jgi:uroporphyrinogen-III synthase
LQGKRIVVTRDEAADGALSTFLRSEGAEVVLWKTTITTAPPDPAAFRQALDDLGQYDWIVFTSARAVESVAEEVTEPPTSPRLAAVGTATARALKSLGWRVDLIPASHGANQLVAAMADTAALKGATVLYPASEIARPALEDGLTELGARVVRITAYRTVHVPVDLEEIESAFATGGVDAVTFTSPSAVDALVSGLGREKFAEVMSRTAVVAIGPTTRQALGEAGVAHPRQPDQSTLEAMAEKLVDLLEE